VQTVPQQSILQPGEIESFAGMHTPLICLPDRSRLFGKRAARLRQLAVGHVMGDYLEFAAVLAEAQQYVLAAMPAFALPGPKHLDQCREHGMPPLNAQSHPRDRQWCDVLRSMLRRLVGDTTGKVREIVLALEGESDEFYEIQAGKLLAGVTLELDRARAPFIGAALQVYWVHMVNALGAGSFETLDTAGVCPACGSLPLASVVRFGVREAGRRYLHCSLCSTEWHMARVKCASCESVAGIHYDGIEGGSKTVLAESCDECGSYLKIFHMEQDPQIEPTADDLSSVALDLLMADSGKLRRGQNLMLIPGEEQ
jgi:FdhE protein